MKQISQSFSSTYQATADTIVVDATKRVEDGRYTVSATIKSENKNVGSIYIDEKQNVTNITLFNDVVYTEDAGVAATLEQNLISWIKQLIDAQAQELISE